ncbi:unnamed protein product [Phytophthora fragariaefolia]|uniref:Unnamed protein product n=1 Tax=Phytophthora fragariaefolia TaxID=1490495 RepID=A0A9W6XZH5_9STRA|nr:unnamed protein product [Phytophthora fragariaefolia]
MCQRICKRYDFTSQKPQKAKLPTAELLEKRAEFSIELWNKYSAWCPTTLFNVDETAINFDMPPTRFWAVKGRKDTARITKMTKHTGRMTAVLTVRGDGTFFIFKNSKTVYYIANTVVLYILGHKLPILFIIRGKLGGDIDRDELPHYPPGHYYTVQEHAWMDAVGWGFYVRNVLRHEIDGPAVLLLDNFDSHVSDKGQRVVVEETKAVVVPFPPNTTAVCQPLDVGVIGPLKAKLRSKFRGITGGTAKQKCLRAIESIIAAWEESAETTIIRSFEKAIPKYPEVLI